ncbi:unnamed protein product [Ilex paraguariensis]|uniref:ABC transmembrane type-1 domain-containing protein n=1 Tax=Ilex paraguariensis TaxID=185542 RepID=A0ABC8UHL6_9AQUA
MISIRLVMGFLKTNVYRFSHMFFKITRLCWARTVERQTSRLRKKYLRAVLRQFASFFDKLDGTSTTYQITESFLADSLTIQGVFSEQLPNFLMNVSTFLSSEVVALYLCWRLVVVAIPALSPLIIPRIINGKMLAEIRKKIIVSYRAIGSITEQAFSSIRTVYSCGGETEMKRSYLEALEQSLDLGIKQRHIKGYVIRSIGIAFAVWSFQAKYDNILVIEKGAIGGDVFTAGVCIVVRGL